MKTTLREIYGHIPCSDGFAQLIYSVTGRKEFPGTGISDQFSLLTEDEKNREIGLIEILEYNGIAHAVWALRCFEYRDYCLFLAEVAESVLPIFEAEHPDDDRPRKAIEAVRDFHYGKISPEELAAAQDAAEKTGIRDIGEAAGDAAWAAAEAAEDDAWSFASNVVRRTLLATYKAAAPGISGHLGVTATTDACTAKWKEIENLFIKHFGEKMKTTFDVKGTVFWRKNENNI